MIVEEYPQNGRVVIDGSHDIGLEVLIAARGSESFSLAVGFHPPAISVGVFLTDTLGWTVLNYLQQVPVARLVLVQMLTLVSARQHMLFRRTFSFFVRPATTEEIKSVPGAQQGKSHAPLQPFVDLRNQSSRPAEHSMTARSPRPQQVHHVHGRLEIPCHGGESQATPYHSANVIAPVKTILKSCMGDSCDSGIRLGGILI